MKNGKGHIDYDLIARLFSGNASDEDNKAIQTWLGKNPVNEDELRRLKTIWSRSEQLYGKTKEKVNVDLAWAQVAEKAGISQKDSDEIKTTRRNPLFYISRIAAVLIIGAIIYIFNFYLYKQSPTIDIVADASTGIQETVLPDGSDITVNESSKISYPKKFSKTERKVVLEGEAFFEVKRIEEKPFKVEANDVLITVLGTSFNVRAIDEENIVEVWVESGKVMVTNPGRTESIILNDSEKGIYNRDLDRLEKIVEDEPNTLFWKTKTLIFRKTPLNRVFQTLERVYRVKINVKEQKILNCRLSGRFRNQTVNEILQNIAENFNLEFEQQGSTITLSGEGCDAP